MVIQLLECYNNLLQRNLTRNAGGTLIGKTEDEVLAAIKTLAVREENVMVARVTLHNMKQGVEMNQFTLLGLDSEGRQVYVGSHNDVPIATLMWTMLKPYYKMCYVC